MVRSEIKWTLFPKEMGGCYFVNSMCLLTCFVSPENWSVTSWNYMVALWSRNVWGWKVESLQVKWLRNLILSYVNDEFSIQTTINVFNNYRITRKYSLLVWWHTSASKCKKNNNICQHGIKLYATYLCQHVTYLHVCWHQHNYVNMRDNHLYADMQHTCNFVNILTYVRDRSMPPYITEIVTNHNQTLY